MIPAIILGGLILGYFGIDPISSPDPVTAAVRGGVRGAVHGTRDRMRRGRTGPGRTDTTHPRTAGRTGNQRGRTDGKRTGAGRVSGAATGPSGTILQDPPGRVSGEVDGAPRRTIRGAIQDGIRSGRDARLERCPGRLGGAHRIGTRPGCPDCERHAPPRPDERISPRLGYCSIHPDSPLDSDARCPECVHIKAERTAPKISGKPYGPAELRCPECGNPLTGFGCEHCLAKIMRRMGEGQTTSTRPQVDGGPAWAAPADPNEMAVARDDDGLLVLTTRNGRVRLTPARARDLRESLAGAVRTARETGGHVSFGATDTDGILRVDMQPSDAEHLISRIDLTHPPQQEEPDMPPTTTTGEIGNHEDLQAVLAADLSTCENIMNALTAVQGRMEQIASGVVGDQVTAALSEMETDAASATAAVGQLKVSVEAVLTAVAAAKDGSAA